MSSEKVSWDTQGAETGSDLSPESKDPQWDLFYAFQSSKDSSRLLSEVAPGFPIQIPVDFRTLCI